MSRPISLKEVSLYFPNRTCFEDFSAQIAPGSRIAIIGRNGVGKSCLLKILSKQLVPSSGTIMMPDDLCTGYVEQTVVDFDELSGGERLNRRLSAALAQHPNLLLLDEPTNHLDRDNRKSLIQMLKRYQGTLVVVSHDEALINHCIDTLWHIDNQKIHQFTGSYDDYMLEREHQRATIEKELALVKRDKQAMHHALMHEQQRAAKSKAKGHKSIDKRKWPTIVSKSKALRAEQTSGKKKSAIKQKRQHLTEQLADLRLPEVILPKFYFTTDRVSANHYVSVSGAEIGYTADDPILQQVSLSVGGKERVAISGKNASGKSTLIKALLRHDEVYTTGSWHLPPMEEIGYLDQHYANLQPGLTVIEHIMALRPDWVESEAWRHLNDFLFRTKAEVMQLVDNLSGGEKARLSLSMIAAKTPRMMILDEMTNNLDLETKTHAIQVLSEYPGAMIVVSHDEAFLQAIRVDHVYNIDNGKVYLG